MTNMIERLYSKGLRQKLLLFQFLLLFVPTIELFNIPTDNGAIPASLCYFFSVAFMPWLVYVRKQIKLPPWYITALFVYVIVWAVIRIPQYGLSRSILHWLFGIYLLLALLNTGADFSSEEWRRLLEIGFCTFAIVHLLYMIWNWRIIGKLLYTYFYALDNGNAGAWLPSLTRGGRNLDCSWLGLGSFFVRGKKKAFYVTYVLLFAFLGSSRAGMIAIGMGILWSLIYDPSYRLTKTNFKFYLFYLTILLVLLFSSGMAQAFFSRFMIHIPSPATWLSNNLITTSSTTSLPSTTSAPSTIISIGGSVEGMLSGRAAIWIHIPEMFWKNPFGYGVGNAMRVMKANYGFSSYENVVHNVFFQWLLDEGFIGGFYYLGFVIALFIQQWKCKPCFFKNPFAAYFLVYITLSLFQFHGAEALMIFVLGIYLQDRDRIRRITE